MKKLTLILMMVLGSVLVRAQHCDSIDNHMAGWYNMNPSGIILLGNGDLLCSCLLYDLDENGNFVYDENQQIVGVRGYQYYWITNNGLSVSDSLFVPGDDKSARLWTRLHQIGNTPQEYPNVEARIVTDENNASFMNIAFFDDQLNFNTDMEVTVPLADAPISFLRGAWLLDSHNDIIFQYSIPSMEETHFVRFGLDGTLKHEKVFTGEQMPFYDSYVPSYNLTWYPQGLSQYSTTGYNYYGKLYQSSGTHAIAYELDSDFNLLNTYDLVDESTYFPNGHQPNTQANGAISAMVSLEQGGALMVRNTKLPNGKNATGVVKYDNNGNVLKEAWFNPFANNREFYCNNLIKDGQGNVFMSGYTTSGHGGDKLVAVIRMDEDLNVIWEYSGMPGEMYREINLTKILDNNIAVLGENEFWQQGSLHVNGMFLTLISKEKGNAGIDEANNNLRPYLYYPNPVADRLNIKYSPDAKPKTVELYDLQGRLIGTQTSGFESIDMQQLPAGTYTMRVVLDNGKTYSDRIVKQ